MERFYENWELLTNEIKSLKILCKIWSKSFSMLNCRDHEMKWVSDINDGVIHWRSLHFWSLEFKKDSKTPWKCYSQNAKVYHNNKWTEWWICTLWEVIFWSNCVNDWYLEHSDENSIPIRYIKEINELQSNESTSNDDNLSFYSEDIEQLINEVDMNGHNDK